MNSKVDTYISAFPEEVKEMLSKIRQIILQSDSAIEEDMAYGMPAYKLNKKPLVYFAAFKHHIGFYATPSGHEQFVKKLAPYKQGKGSVQFPFSEAIPYDLIEEMTQFRVLENSMYKKK